MKKPFLEIIKRRVIESRPDFEFIEMELKMNRPSQPAKHGTIKLRGKIKDDT